MKPKLHIVNSTQAASLYAPQGDVIIVEGNVYTSNGGTGTASWFCVGAHGQSCYNEPTIETPYIAEHLATVDYSNSISVGEQKILNRLKTLSGVLLMFLDDIEDIIDSWPEEERDEYVEAKKKLAEIEKKRIESDPFHWIDD